MQQKSKEERVNVRLTPAAKADMETVRDWAERSLRGGIRINASDVVLTALRLAVEYLTGEPQTNSTHKVG